MNERSRRSGVQGSLANMFNAVDVAEEDVPGLQLKVLYKRLVRFDPTNAFRVDGPVRNGFYARDGPTARLLSLLSIRTVSYGDERITECGRGRWIG